MSSKKLKLVYKIPNSNIVIDYWKPCSKRFYRFMTTLRLEDTNSLEMIRQSSYIIYTSGFNKWYLENYYQVPENRIIPLPYNKTISISDGKEDQISVTAFDANYYAGSMMFLFQGIFGNVFFTGFFRSSPSVNIFEVPILKTLIEKKTLHTVYIDNTYAAEHCQFPSRREVVEDIVMFLRSNSNFKIGISGKLLGKEEVLIDIAENLNEQIAVSETKFKMLSYLNREKHFTTKQENCRIQTFDRILNKIECHQRQAQTGPYVVILLTAFYECKKKILNSMDNHNVKIFPYSSHCSHSELMDFVSKLRPKNLLPIIKSDESNSLNTTIPKSMNDLCIELCDSPIYYDALPDLPDSDGGQFFTCPSSDDISERNSCKNHVSEYQECDAIVDISAYSDEESNASIYCHEKLPESIIDSNTSLYEKMITSKESIVKIPPKSCIQEITSTTSKEKNILPPNYHQEVSENVISSTNSDDYHFQMEVDKFSEPEEMVLTQCQQVQEIRNEFTSQKILEVPTPFNEDLPNPKLLEDKSVQTETNEQFVNELSSLKFSDGEYVDEYSFKIAQVVFKNPSSTILTNEFYKKLIHSKNKSCVFLHRTCRPTDCPDCKKRAKLNVAEKDCIRTALHRYSSSKKSNRPIGGVRKYDNLKGSEFFSHLMYQNTEK